MRVTTMIDLLAVLALAFNGIAAGALLGSLVGPVRLLLALPAEGYVRAKQFMIPRYDPAMPIIIVATTILDVLLTIFAPGTLTRLTFGIAALVLVLVVIISVTKNVPVNKWEQTLDPEALPKDFAERDPRPTWHRWHLIRTSLLTVALVVAVAAHIMLLRQGIA
jgi:Ca2+/Na+ antiporter